MRDELNDRMRRKLVAEDGGFGGGDFDAHEAMIFVEEELDFEIGGGGAESLGVGLIADGGGAGGLDGDVAGSEFLRDEDGKSLRAAFGPIVEAGEDGVVMVEVVVENGD